MMASSAGAVPEPSTSAAGEDVAKGGVGSGGTSGLQSEQTARPNNNVQRIQQRKKQVFNWLHSKKLLKLAIYSACQVIYLKNRNVISSLSKILIKFCCLLFFVTNSCCLCFL